MLTLQMTHKYAAVFSLLCALSALFPRLAAAREDQLQNEALPHMTSGDMNGDGKPDLVIANDNAAGVSIKFNAGTSPFFATAATNLAAANPAFVAVGDLNGDGRADIVTGNSSGNTVRVFLQAVSPAPAGQFPGTPSSSSTVGTSAFSNPLALVLVDVNGDGKLDIVTANNADDNISVLLNNGNGTFAAAVNTSVAANPNSIAAGDVNGDGKADLVAAFGAGNSVNVLLNSGTGTFPTPFSVAVGDFQKFVTLQDFNADGKLDLGLVLSAGTSSNSVAILAGEGDGTFQNAISNPVPVNSQNFATGDATGDGKKDLILATSFGPTAPSIFGLRGNGDGTFRAATDFQFTVPAVATATVLADFDGDGQLDVATSCVNPAPAGLYIEKLNPRATLASLSPAQAISGGAAFTLTLNGSGFINGATVQWNGVNRTTTFASATQLTASIPASDLLTAGKIPVTVINPAPGGFASDAQFFSVYPTTLGVFTVLNTNDSGSGSLRFAMQQARNSDTINFDPVVFDLTNSDAATVINVLSELPPLDDGAVVIDAQDRRVTVNGSGAGSACGMVLNSSSNKIMGLTLVAFSQSGVCIRGGAKSNQIGGTRSTGSGPNGQGLRISNCGAFGIEINGAGADSNGVKGCWIGLDSSGTVAEPNLAGILIQNGAKTNTIGGTAGGEANAISGNKFEGVTFSGAGTDDNAVLSSIVGEAAVATAPRGVSARDALPTRAAAGNGSAGVFLSKGTKGGKVGGTNPGEGSSVANNGGNGIEVRSGTSQRNSSRANKIARNIKGGISLFDGSNDGITPPAEDEVIVGATTGTTRKVRVRGSAARDGTIELFNDSGSQGETPLGRGSVVGGRFDIEVDSTISQKLTATLTDANGNTSAFKAITVTEPGGVNTADTDGDGASDALETLAGTDVNNASDKPLDGGILVVDKAAAGVNFTTTGKDSLKATILLILPAGFFNENAGINIQFGSVTQNFKLDSKGKSPKAAAAVSLKGGSVLPGPAKAGAISLSMKGDLRAALAASGLTDKTTAKTGEAVTVPVLAGVVFGTSKYVFAGQVSLLYKATQGKGGKAAKAK